MRSQDGAFDALGRPWRAELLRNGVTPPPSWPRPPLMKFKGTCGRLHLLLNTDVDGGLCSH